MRHAALIALVLGACGGAGDSSDDGYDYGSQGAVLYTELCAVCHGEVGEGGLGPVLQDSSRDQAFLAAAIDTRMPAGDPDRCTGECADAIAAFIREGLTSGALDCGERRTPSPRRLRLLTRFEYANTVRDLFGDGGGNAGCSHRFAWDANGRQAQTVHIAGSFNNWAATIAGGGWALARPRLSPPLGSVAHHRPGDGRRHHRVWPGLERTDRSDADLSTSIIAAPWRSGS
jgi:hypothetical protein